MKKKIVSVLLTAAMTAGLVAGCGGTAEDAGSSQGTAATGTEAVTGTEGAEEGWTGEVEPVVMTMLNAGADIPYMDEIAEKITEYTRDKIGVELTIKQVSYFDAASQYTMWVGSGESVDLMQIAFMPITSFSAMNMLEPLDDYLQYAPTITEMAEEGYAIYNPGTEEVYGISVIGSPAAGTCGGLWVFTDALEATGLDYEDGQIVTMDEIDTIVRAIKEQNPDAYFGVYGQADRSNMSFANDPLGASITSGVLVGTDSTTVVDFYETEEYQKYIEVLRGWYQDGIVLKDAATTDAADAGSMINDPDNCLMMFNSADLSLRQSYESQTGKEVTMLYTSEIYQVASSTTGGYMTIPVTSQHPEAAMRFLDLLYSDAYVYNLLGYGIEGETYNVIEEEHHVVQAIDDCGYYCIGSFGNQLLLYPEGVYDPDLETAKAEWTEKGLANPTKAVGFCYDATNMTNQITALDAVISEYSAALCTGAADIDTVYPEFINKLKANGMDEVIADKQAQFDEWLNQ